MSAREQRRLLRVLERLDTAIPIMSTVVGATHKESLATISKDTVSENTDNTHGGEADYNKNYGEENFFVGNCHAHCLLIVQYILL